MRTDTPKSLLDSLTEYSKTLEKRKKYLKTEYQVYGLELAKEMGEWDKRSIYIRLAKNTDRWILEKAREFIKDQTKSTIKSPGKLFMWKIKELRQEKTKLDKENAK